MRARLSVLLVIVVALSGCSGGGSASAPDADGRAVERAAGAALRRAQMQSGTSWADGVLASFCSEGRCTRDEDAQPRRTLLAAGSGLLMFIVPQRPVSSSVVISRKRGRPVLQEPLPPGTTMPVRASLRSGTYLVALNARWDSHEARWLFGLRVGA